jgi:hypothetical protein
MREKPESLLTASGRVRGSMTSVQILWLAALCMTGITENVLAQQVATDPGSTHIFPAGGRRGTRVDVNVGGECLPPGTRFRLFGDGVSAPLELGAASTAQYAPSPRRRPGEQQITCPREWKSQLTIADDAKTGVRLWRLGCARGGTGGRPFIIGDLPEFIESEPNSRSENAQHVELPVTINGQIAGESDLDYFRFQIREGDIVRVDVAAGRLGSALDPVAQITGPDGNRITGDDLRVGADPVMAFRAATTGEYRLLISNVNFHGGPNFVYRATISTAPLTHFAFPPGGQSGTTREITYYALSGEGTRKTFGGCVTFPHNVGEFWNDAGSGTNSVPLIAGDLQEANETENNDSRETAQDLSWPLTMNGQFESAADEDWFRITARQGVAMTIECAPHPRWSPTLPVVDVTNPDGGVLASVSAVQTTTGIIRLEWHPPMDGAYFLRLRDLQQGIRGGPEFIYRLRVSEAVPDFVVSLKSDCINVVQGGRTEIDALVERRGGCVAAVELIVEGLPDGIRVEGLQVAAGQQTAKLALVADPEVRSGDTTLRIKGRAEIGGKTIEHPALATHLGHDVDGIGLDVAHVDHVQLTIVHKPVFKLYCNEAYQYAHRGTVYPYLMEVERLDGFDGPIHLQVADRQIKDLDGIEVLRTTIGPGESRVMLPVYLPETMHINVQAHSNVYAQGYVEFQDKFNQKQTLLVVSTMRCMIRTLPTVAKLRPLDRELVVQPGRVASCGLAIDRTAHFSGSMTVELVDPVAGVTATPVTIPANHSRTEIAVQIDPGMQPCRNLNLRFRARGMMSGEVEVIAETTIPVAFAK